MWRREQPETYAAVHSSEIATGTPNSSGWPRYAEAINKEAVTYCIINKHSLMSPHECGVRHTALADAHRARHIQEV